MKSKSDASLTRNDVRLFEQISAIEKHATDISVAVVRITNKCRSQLDGPRHQVVLPHDVVLEIFCRECVELLVTRDELRWIGAAQHLHKLQDRTGRSLGLGTVVRDIAFDRRPLKSAKASIRITLSSSWA